jgi:hypothetical protein
MQPRVCPERRPGGAAAVAPGAAGTIAGLGAALAAGRFAGPAAAFVRNALATAFGYPRFEVLMVAPLAATGYAVAGPGPAEPRPGLLEVPASWSPGDVAVVLPWDGGGAAAERERLIGGLLEAGFAVLGLEPATPRGGSADGARTPRPRSAGDLVPDLLGAADALRRRIGVGAVAAVGHGPAGDAALLAAADARIAAGARLGAGGRFAEAPAMRSTPGWPAEAALLRAVIAGAVDIPWPAAACPLPVRAASAARSP